MSGGGTGGGGNLGGGGGIPTIDCGNISIKTNITSPDPIVLKQLKKGELLGIELQTATGPLIAITNSREIVGSVFTTNPKLLIDCIAKGFAYKGRILQIDEGDCQILISAK